MLSLKMTTQHWHEQVLEIIFCNRKSLIATIISVILSLTDVHDSRFLPRFSEKMPPQLTTTANCQPGWTTQQIIEVESKQNVKKYWLKGCSNIWRSWLWSQKGFRACLNKVQKGFVSKTMTFDWNVSCRFHY